MYGDRTRKNSHLKISESSASKNCIETPLKTVTKITGKYEKRALNFACLASSASFYLFKKVRKFSNFYKLNWKAICESFRHQPYFTYCRKLYSVRKIQNGPYQQCNQLTSHVVDTYLVYDVATSSFFFGDLNFLYEYQISRF